MIKQSYKSYFTFPNFPQKLFLFLLEKFSYLSVMIQLKKAGRKPKYNFEGFDLNETRVFKKTGEKPSSTILSCAYSYCKLRGFKWEFKSYTTGGGKVHLIRIK